MSARGMPLYKVEKFFLRFAVVACSKSRADVAVWFFVVFGMEEIAVSRLLRL